MRIVYLDSYAANPGDIDWKPWQGITDAEGRPVEFVAYERTAPEETIGRAMGAEMLLTNKVVINAEVMDALPELRYVGVMATGFNVVDTAHAAGRGIVVTNIPAYSTDSVAQMAMAHLLNIALHVGQHSESVTSGRWQASRDFCYWESPLIELKGLLMGIVGLGHTGMATARIALGMGMRVTAWSSKEEEALGALGIAKAASLEELFASADVVSLHCPLTPETHHLVCAQRLRLMKPSAIIINTGRGPLIDEQALADALNEGHLYAAGLDVLEQEPPREGSPLIGARNCYITPHIAWASLAARRRLMDIALGNVEAFLRGEPRNVVNNL